jgi:hypothetical protein
MVESSRNELGTTQDQLYAQRMYLVNLYIIVHWLLCPSGVIRLCLIVFICFRRINHMAVKNHLHSSSGVHEIVSGRVRNQIGSSDM